MKITIEGTNQNKGSSVSVEWATDDCDIVEVMEYIKQALLGYGFQAGSIADYFNVEGE
jgi:hypothetical protein